MTGFVRLTDDPVNQQTGENCKARPVIVEKGLEASVAFAEAEAEEVGHLAHSGGNGGAHMGTFAETLRTDPDILKTLDKAISGAKLLSRFPNGVAFDNHPWFDDRSVTPSVSYT